MGVEEGEPSAGGEQRIALPLARAQAGTGAGGGNARRSGVLAAFDRARARLGNVVGPPSPRAGAGSEDGWESARITWAW